MVGEIVTWVLDKVFHRVGRRLNQAEPKIEDAAWNTSHMVNSEDVSLNVVMRIVNGGRATAESYRAEAHVSGRDGVTLGLTDPKNPGDATRREQND
jgi:hypothetical protein